MFHLSVLLPFVFLLYKTQAYYIPASGEDWTKLKPCSGNLPGSYVNLPFEFGIVVNQYHVENSGNDFLLDGLEIGSYNENLETTTIMTNTVISTPKAKLTRNIAFQINDGQVLNKAPGQECSKHSLNHRFSCDAGDTGVINDNRHNEHITSNNKDILLKLPSTNAVNEAQEPLCNKEVQSDNKIKKTNNKERKQGNGLLMHYGLFKKVYKKEREDGEETPEACKKGHSKFITPTNLVACYTDSSLRMKLEDSILRDSKGRIGCIVSNHQFQFDGPVPQHGAIYAAGWSVTMDGKLALGDCTKFYQCATGEFYKLYNQQIGPQCQPVTLEIVELINCGGE